MELVTVTQAARAVGVTADTLRRWHARGLLPPGSVILSAGGHRRVDVQAVRDWMQKKSAALQKGGKA